MEIQDVKKLIDRIFSSSKEAVEVRKMPSSDEFEYKILLLTTPNLKQEVLDHDENLLMHLTGILNYKLRQIGSKQHVVIDFEVFNEF